MPRKLSPDSIASRVWRYLHHHGPSDAGDIARAMDVNPASVHRALSDHKRMGRAIRRPRWEAVG